LDKKNINTKYYFEEFVNRGVVNILQKEAIPLTLQQAYTQWKSQTKINLHSNLVLQSREPEIEYLLTLLTQQPSKIIVVSARGKDESYALMLMQCTEDKCITIMLTPC